MIKMLRKMWNDDKGISGPFPDYIIAVAIIALLVPPFIQEYPKMRWEIILLSIVATVIIIKLEYSYKKNITKKIEKNETDKT